MKYLFSILILILVPIIVLSFRVHESHLQQYFSLSDFNSNNYERDIDYENLIVDFPNIGVTTIPLSFLKAEYFFSRNRIKEALDLYHKSLKANPYLGMSEAKLADLYFQVEIKDSALYYSDQAYKLLPLNSKHFFLKLKSLAVRGQVKKLDEIILNNYRDLKQVTENKNYLSRSWLFYLATIYQYRFNDKNKYDSIANIPLKLFPDNQDIIIASNFIKYGKDSVQEALKIDEKATIEYNKSNYKKSFKLFSKSVELWPKNPYSINSAGMSAYMLNDFKNSVFYLEKLFDFEKPKNGNIEYYMYKSLLKNRDTIKACKYYNMLMSINPKLISSEGKICK